MNQKKGHKNKKKTIAMLLVMAIFISILPDSFTASAAEIIKEATETTPALTMQFQINSAWGGSIAADIILTNKGSKNIENWEITYNWKPVITSLWCAQYQAEEKAGQEGAADTNRYTIRPYEYNNTIHPGSEIRIGLIASGEEAELVEPESYEIKINGENWVYDTQKGGLKKPEETEEPTKEPEITERPEETATPEETEEPTTAPEITKEPEVTEAPEKTEIPTEKPEITTEPEITANPEITATPEETEKPTTAPEITAEPGISAEPEPTEEPENTPAPTTTPEPTKEPDYNLEDHEFTDDLIITSDKTLTKNTSCKNLYIKSGTLNTDGYQLTVRENAEQSGGRLTIEKQSKVTIKGKTTLTAGILALNDGRLQTEGNFKATETGELQLNTEKSHTIIGGNCHLESRQRISGGILEIKGNLNIPHKSWLKNGNNVNIKLSGSKTQSVTTEEETYLHNLDLTESNGVEFMQPIHAGTLTGIQNITGEKATFAVEEVSLAKDTELNYDVEIKSGTWKPGSNKLIIAGNLELTGGSLLAEEGEIEIQGDLHAAGGELNLRSEKAHVVVEGDCQIESGQRINGGLLEIKGNLNIPYKSWLKNGSNVNIKLSGSRLQSVTAEEETKLHNLDLTESAGVEFHQPIHADTLTGIENITGEKNTFAVGDISLTKDTKLKYEVEIQSGEWKLGQNKLTIAENLELTGGSLDTEEGIITIQGDLHAAGGELNLWSEKAHVTIEGDCCIESGQRISGGLIEIKENLNIPYKNWLKNGNNVNIKLSGSRIQKVITEEEVYLYNLDITESKGVTFKNTVNARMLYGIEKLTGNHTKINVSTAKPSTDGSIPGRLTVLGGSIDSDGHSLTIEKKLTIKSGSISTATEGSTLTLKKNCKMQGGNLTVGKGTIRIEADCDISGTAGIAMKEEEGILHISGDLTSSSTTASQLTAGSIHAGGDILQTEEAAKNSLNIQGKLYFTGQKKQTVDIAYPAGSVITYADLKAADSVSFNSAVHIHDMDGWEKIGGSSLTLCGYTGELQKDTEYKGYLVLVSSAMHLNGYRFTVSGLEQYDTIMDAKRGKLYVDGNYGIYGKSYLYMNWSDEAEVVVKGDFETLSEMSHRVNCLEHGTLYLWGNLIQGGTNYSFAIGEDYRIKFMQNPPSQWGKEQIVSQKDPDASLIRKKNWDNPNGAEVIFNSFNEMDISPSNLYHSFCLGIGDAIEEAPEKLGSYAAWAAIFNAAAAVGKYCGVSVTAGAAEGTIEAGAVAGGELTVAILVCFLAGYLCFNYNEITGSLNKVFYDLGKITAECVIIALIGYFEAAAVGMLLTDAAFQNIVRQSSIYIKRIWNGTVLHVEVEEILLCFGGTTSLAEILKQHLTDKAAAYMAKMQALNALPDTAMRAAYNFIKGHCAGIEVTLREFRLILKNIGKMAGEKLKALTDWVKKKPAHYDKIEAEGLELLQEEEAELAEKGLLEKVEEALQKESEGLTDDAALGLDDVEAVIEKVEKDSVDELIAKAKKIINFDNPADPFRDVFGKGMDSDPIEWNNLIKQLEDNGVEVIYRKGAMGYAPLKDGEPGQILIDPDASMSALRHEYSHFLEAKKNGYPSAAKCYQNWQARIEDELKAYTIEIEEAKRLGLDNVVAQLEKNFEEEKQYIIQMYGPIE